MKALIQGNQAVCILGVFAETDNRCIAQRSLGVWHSLTCAIVVSLEKTIGPKSPKLWCLNRTLTSFSLVITNLHQVWWAKQQSWTTHSLNCRTLYTCQIATSNSALLLHSKYPGTHKTSRWDDYILWCCKTRHLTTQPQSLPTKPRWHRTCWCDMDMDFNTASSRKKNSKLSVSSNRDCSSAAILQWHATAFITSISFSRKNKSMYRQCVFPVAFTPTPCIA